MLLSWLPWPTWKSFSSTATSGSQIDVRIGRDLERKRFIEIDISAIDAGGDGRIRATRDEQQGTAEKSELLPRLYLVIGPGVVAVLVLAGFLILIAELVAQQRSRVVRNSPQPLFHRLLLFLPRDAVLRAPRHVSCCCGITLALAAPLRRRVAVLPACAARSSSLISSSRCDGSPSCCSPSTLGRLHFPHPSRCCSLTSRRRPPDRPAVAQHCPVAACCCCSSMLCSRSRL